MNKFFAPSRVQQKKTVRTGKGSLPPIVTRFLRIIGLSFLICIGLQSKSPAQIGACNGCGGTGCTYNYTLTATSETYPYITDDIANTDACGRQFLIRTYANDKVDLVIYQCAGLNGATSHDIYVYLNGSATPYQSPVLNQQDLPFSYRDAFRFSCMICCLPSLHR